MLKIEELKNRLHKIDGKGYKAYKGLNDIYSADNYTLYIDHVQGDPFAQPSRIRVRIDQEISAFPVETYENRSREIALRDYLTRKFYESTGKISGGIRGSGKSGLISINRPGQEILERTSVFINDKFAEARFLMGLPAHGRRISGSVAIDMFFRELPEIINSSLLFPNLIKESVYNHIQTSEDADYLREQLGNRELIAFVADGSILPRKSGIDDRPLTSGKIINFESPESLRVSFSLPNLGEIRGLGVKRGITLIVGGGYHGKSTLLNALELGIYNHIPGDGREFVVTDRNAVKIRAEDGRKIEKTCITPFISNLPFGQDTGAFSTEDASGSTSQSANIIEAVETGASALLIDEDTSATNFMIRDHRMQELVSKDMEPITPFIDKVRHLHKDHGISTLLVIGGSGDYFDVADFVICMVEYRPVEVTEEASRIADKYRSERKKEGGEDFGTIKSRIPEASSLNPSRGKKDVKINIRGTRTIEYGEQIIDIGAVEQVVDPSQTRAIADAIYYSTKYMDGKRTIKEIIETVMDDIDRESMDILSPWIAGNYASFRGLELAATINRVRSLRVKQKT